MKHLTILFRHAEDWWTQCSVTRACVSQYLDGVIRVLVQRV